LTSPTRAGGKKPALVTLLAKAANNESKETELLPQSPQVQQHLPVYLKNSRKLRTGSSSIIKYVNC
jgi:hypothetical protein